MCASSVSGTQSWRISAAHALMQEGQGAATEGLVEVMNMKKFKDVWWEMGGKYWGISA